MRSIEYVKALIIKIKYWHITNWNAHIVYHKPIKRYIVFCEQCHEYICSDGLCSNGICPEEIRDMRE